jgi:hypothetical protein
MSTSAKAKGKRRAMRLEPTAALPLGKQLAHTGESLDTLVLYPVRQLIIYLSSNFPSDLPDKLVRDHAIESLSLFLSHGGNVSEQGGDVTLDGNKAGGAALSDADMRKLWKGLFYCQYLQHWDVASSS